MARSAPSSISQIEPHLLHDLLSQPEDAASSSSFIRDCTPDNATTPTPTPIPATRVYRAASWGSPWGVVTVGRGSDWRTNSTPVAPSPDRVEEDADPDWGLPLHVRRRLALNTACLNDDTRSPHSTPTLVNGAMTSSPPTDILSTSAPASSNPLESLTPTRPTPTRSSTAQSSRRRSSAKRVSLVAGRVSVIPNEPVSSPPLEPTQPRTPKLSRFGSTSSFLSVQSAAPPSERSNDSFLGGRSIDEFEIEEEIGRGAYGLVKKAREVMADGELGPPIIIKQIIKSRILADCWKKHPKYGTIPIEIYVMSAISSSTYTLPPPRPWDPARNGETSDWIEGNIVHGHPNICPLLDFFEDQHYYYLLMPYSIPELPPGLDEPPPKDLFDLVEMYPQGLPPAQIRSYLGQLADALCYLHLKGIVHRDIKDENVVLGPHQGKCILIDFGSSGVVRKNGWDTFSGTLDYAGPEILRGERYTGKEQDVWAFGVVAYVLLVGECPFVTPAEAQEGLTSLFSKPTISLDERCGGEHGLEGEEADGGGALGDAAALVRACLQIEVSARPTFDRILESRFLRGRPGWGREEVEDALVI